mmetsp:Transcript_43863/g.70497  ORF Transcript_43863/g.70497 Transcript_43863/m.70497 type:complete len:197 (+) Transcript_43863:130-720(+)
MRRTLLATGRQILTRLEPCAASKGAPVQVAPRAPGMLAVLARSYARGVVRKGSRPKAKAGGPPPALKDPWEEVQDQSSGQSYWWNVQTNETTAVGAPKPQPGALTEATPPAAPRSMLGSLGTVVAEGFAFGTGSALAHRAVGSLMGGGGGYGDQGGGGGGAPPAPGEPAEEQSSSFGGEMDDDGGDGEPYTPNSET